MNRQSMSTVPCFKSSNEVSDLLLLDSQLGGAGCALCIPFKLVDAASSIPVQQLLL